MKLIYITFFLLFTYMLYPSQCVPLCVVYLLWCFHDFLFISLPFRFLAFALLAWWPRECVLSMNTSKLKANGSVLISCDICKLALRTNALHFTCGLGPLLLPCFSNYIHYFMWGVIAYPWWFSWIAVEVRTLMCNYISQLLWKYLLMHGIISGHWASHACFRNNRYKKLSVNNEMIGDFVNISSFISAKWMHYI